MIILLSPAKTLDFESQSATEVCTQPDFLKFSKFLVNGLNKLSAAEIGQLMSISPKLAELNRKRFQEWAARHDAPSKQAVLALYETRTRVWAWTSGSRIRIRSKH